MNDPIARIVAAQLGENNEQLELLPITMIYFTVKIDQSRGWSDRVLIQSPDGKTVVQSWGRQGGWVAGGLQKCLADLEVAYQMAAGIGPFDDLPVGSLPGDPADELADFRKPE